MLGPCIVTREFMNQVKERGVDDAQIIFINRLDQFFYIGSLSHYFILNHYSTLGHLVPHMSSVNFYCATKFAITAIAEGVRQELREMKSNCRATVSIIYSWVNSEVSFHYSLSLLV